LQSIDKKANFMPLSKAKKTFICLSGCSSFTYLVYNIFLKEENSTSKLEKISFLWNLNASYLALILIALIFLFLVCGKWYFYCLAHKQFKRSIKAFIFSFLSIGLFFCFIFPPFQGPDEPDHFNSY